MFKYNMGVVPHPITDLLAKKIMKDMITIQDKFMICK